MDENLKVCFLLAFLPNPRMKKRIALLSKTYKVELIYWAKSASLYGDTLPDIPVHAIDVELNSDSKAARLKATFSFFRKAQHALRLVCPDFIYVQNLDMLAVACKYNFLRRKKAKIIYEIADIHQLIIDKQIGLRDRAIQYAIKCADKVFAHSVDILVNTTRAFYDEYYYRFIPENKLVVIPNIPEAPVFSEFKRVKNDKFTVGFIGLIRFKRQMQMLIEAAKEANINAFFAGSEVAEPENPISIEKLAKQNQHVRYLGKFNYETDIKNLYESADAIYSVYDTTKRDICIALPNKLFEAIYCELPIIAAQGTYLAKLVDEWGVGITVSPSDSHELAVALAKLSTDSALYTSILDNCKRKKAELDLQKYNHDLLTHMEKCINS